MDADISTAAGSRWSSSKSGFLSFSVLRAALGLAAGPFKLLAALVTRAKRHGEKAGMVRLGASALAALLRCSRRHIFRLVRRLEASGFLVVHRRKLGKWALRNTYTLVLPGLVKSGAEVDLVSGGAVAILEEFIAQHNAAYCTDGVGDVQQFRRELRQRSALIDRLIQELGMEARSFARCMVREYLADPGRNGFLSTEAHPSKYFLVDFEKLAARVAKQKMNRKTSSPAPLPRQGLRSLKDETLVHLRLLQERLRQK